MKETLSTNEWVIMFVPRHYEYTEPSPPRLVFGPDSKYNCEQQLKLLDAYGGPAGGFHRIERVKIVIEPA